MNIIFPKIIDLIENSQSFPTKESRRTFEGKFQKIVTSEISRNYKSKEKLYISQSNHILDISKDSIKSVIEEIFPPKDHESNYPMCKYFTYSVIPNEDKIREMLSEKEDSKNLYPVLFHYFKHKDDIETLRHIHNMLPFELDFINRYSFQISREESKSKYISSELANMDDQKVSENYKKFESSFNHFTNVEDLHLQFECRPELKRRELDENKQIGYCLNDNGELGFGMYLAAINQRFIQYQNGFLVDITTNITPENNLFYLKERLERKILLENATKSNIVSFDLEKSVYDFILAFTHRNCYIGNTIDYKQFSKTIIDLKAIDEEYGLLVLPNKVQFSSEQKFVIYKFEAYRNNKSQIILNYSNKYKQKSLTDAQKNHLKQFVSNIENNKTINVSDLMFSLQQLIAFFEKQSFTNETPIVDGINKLPRYLKIQSTVLDFFKNNSDFTMDVLIEIYEHIELLCVDEIMEHVEGTYKEDLEREDIEKINKTLQLFPYSGITKEDLANAVRKYICRMFGGRRMDMEEPNSGLFYMEEPNSELFYYLSREELWPVSLRNNEDVDIENTMYELQAQFGITKAKSVEFYYYLIDKKSEPIIKHKGK
jgi:hypothetical protein